MIRKNCSSTTMGHSSLNMAEAERALIAAKEGDLQTLKSLRRSVPFAADAYGATTLHYASRKGHLACVKWLVEAIGISPIVRGKSGATPLHDAAAQGQLHCVKYFLAGGVVDVDIRDVSGHTALHLAARFGRFETAKWLIDEGNSSVRVKSRNYMTPVHFCASGGHLTCLEFLVFKAGESSVNEPATDGTTPVYLAAQDGNLECLKYLHSVGGKCDARARDGMLPVHGAAQNGHLDCIAYLIESDLAKFDERDTSGATPAHYAAAQGHVNVLKWLILKGDISLTDDLGGSPLHDAAEQGQFESVRFLVEDASLDVDHRDKEGFTPLALAVKSGHRRCVDYLKIAASKKAKAEKRQLIFSKQKSEDGSSFVMSIASEKAIDNYRPSDEYLPKMTDAMNHPFMSDFDRNSRDKSGEVKIQAKGNYSSFSFRKGNSAVSFEESLNTAKPNSSALNDCLNSGKFADLNNNTSSIGSNIGNHNSIKIAGVYSSIGGNNIKWRGNSKLKKQERIEITDSVPSTDPTSPVFETAKFSAYTTHLRESSSPDASEKVKVLGECRFQTLPLFGSDVIPPPVEFSENSVFTRL